MGALQPLDLKKHPEEVKIIVDGARLKGLCFDETRVVGDIIKFYWEGRNVRTHRVVSLPATVALATKRK